MPSVIDKLLDMSPDDFKRWRTKKGATFAPYKKRGNTRQYTKKELAEYLKRNNYRTRDALRAGRSPDDPNDRDYRNAYGSWTAAVREIFNIKDFSRRYIVQSVVEFELWTQRSYRLARKSRPDVFPPVSVVLREFGNWSGLKQVAAAFSLKKTLESYMLIKDGLGRRPSLEDCRRAGLVLDTAIEMYGGKRGLDRFVDSLESVR